ncbi:MAG: peptide chain release factor N(5)-glutamine methyltransferase [Hyphomicrobiaceae bacterium]|nr:peptide chain release factor N(5)-glutamine methyltransferase [Hyphomicrobiaceae bacterium]
MPETISETSFRSLTAAAAAAQAARLLREAGIEPAAREGRLLVAAALGVDAGRLLSRPETPLGAAEEAVLDSLVARRIAREPVSRILGSRGFYGRDFEISPATLDPRPDSETLIEAGLELIGHDEKHRSGPWRVLDIGTGSGCLLVTLLAELPNSTGLGTDIDPRALETAERNARRHGVARRARWKLARSLDGIGGPVDLLVANPPYVPTGEIAGLEPEVRDYDPRAALDGGADGLDVYREIARDLIRVVPNGRALFEVGAGQAGALCQILAATRVGDHPPEVRTFRDLNGIDRCVAWKALH